MIWSAAQLREALSLPIHPNISGEQIRLDSREIKNGDIFIAFSGTQTDGHEFAVEALRNGASVLILTKMVQNISPEKIILVESAMGALDKMAAYKRKKSKATFIGITGSVGKTSTKESIVTLLRHFAPTFGSRGNYNNDLGLRINLASLPTEGDIRYAIFELGMNHTGEIRELSKLLKPHISIITNANEAHLQNFDTVLDITKAKCEIFDGMNPHTGIALINRDDESFEHINQHLDQKLFEKKNIFYFGNKTPGRVHSRLLSYQLEQPLTHVVYDIEGEKITRVLNAISKHNAFNYAIPLLIASILQLNMEEAADQLCKIELIEGRGKMIQIRSLDGLKHYDVITDYYNACPASMRAGLKYFKGIVYARKTLIIGDMLQLGNESPKFHLELVNPCLESGAKKIILVGTFTKLIFEALEKNKMDSILLHHFKDVEELMTSMDSILDNEELIFVKGSSPMKLSEIVKRRRFSE